MLGKVIVTCSLLLDAANTDLVVAHTSSGAEAESHFPAAAIRGMFRVSAAERSPLTIRLIVAGSSLPSP